jgi:hypothetical protein
LVNYRVTSRELKFAREKAAGETPLSKTPGGTAAANRRKRLFYKAAENFHPRS